MKKRTRSILNELQNFITDDDKNIIIENRANHIIQSAINLINQIRENYDKDSAEELEKRFFSSIRNKDPRRFERTIRQISENSKDF